MTDLTPATLGRQMADREVREAVLGLLQEVTATERAQASVKARPSPDDAAFLVAKRKRLEGLRDELGRPAATVSGKPGLGEWEAV